MYLLNSISSFIRQNQRHLLVDVSVFAVIYLLPALSHLVPFPLYLIEPMRIALFAGYLFSRNGYNAAFLAVTLPLFSMWTTGHPVFFKSLLISVELLANILLFILFFQRFRLNVFVALVSSILLSKVIYYGFKFTFLQGGLLAGNLISTGLQNQLITLLGLAMLFSVLFHYFFKRDR